MVYVMVPVEEQGTYAYGRVASQQCCLEIARLDSGKGGVWRVGEDGGLGGELRGSAAFASSETRGAAAAAARGYISSSSSSNNNNNTGRAR